MLSDVQEKWLQDDCQSGWRACATEVTHLDAQTYTATMHLVGGKKAITVLRKNSETILCNAPVPDRAIKADPICWKNADCCMPQNHDCPHVALTFGHHTVAIESLSIGSS